ncbi:MAG: hypothetical protein ACFBSE_08890 [Prochloraceae cyanobacterium]
MASAKKKHFRGIAKDGAEWENIPSRDLERYYGSIDRDRKKNINQLLKWRT